MPTLDKIIIRGYRPFFEFFDNGLQLTVPSQNLFRSGLKNCNIMKLSMTEEQSNVAKTMQATSKRVSRKMKIHYKKCMLNNGFTLKKSRVNV